jgi:hypothetical protein
MPKKTKTEDKTTQSSGELWVVTSELTEDIGTRGGPQSLDVEKLAVNVNLFIQNMGKVLDSTPEKLGNFHFDEFEIHAEISADGTLAILGSGVHVGGSGGLRFVFRRGTGQG